MRASSLINRLRRSLAENGGARTLRLLGPRLYRHFFPVRIPTHPFDLRHGVDTSGLIYREKLTSGHPHDEHITAYWGTSPSLFRGALHHWHQTLEGTPYRIEDYTFLDIGCGKGRAVMLASEASFRRVIGVELNPALAYIAQQNLARWQESPHKCSDITVLNADALTVALPDTPVLLYLFNPFDAHVTQLLLDRLHSLSFARSSPIDLIYTRPEQAALVEAMPRISLLWSGDVPLTPEDTAADAFHTLAQDTRIYRQI